jgi:prepilin-type processing-associated H-X9-DG protein
VGEKAINSDQYETGWTVGDQRSMFECLGFHDCERLAESPPIQDPRSLDWELQFARQIEQQGGTPQVGSNAYRLFGSAHPAAWNVVFCDGHVRSLSFNISQSTHQALATRAGGEHVTIPD